MEPNKIFGIGLSRTGTTSLTKALNILDIKTTHYPIDDITYRQLFKGDYNLSIMKNYGALIEGIGPFYKQFDETFKKAKFILTTRQTGSWLKSIENHLIPMSNFERFNSNLNKGGKWHKMTVLYHLAAFGSVYFNKSKYKQAFENHNENVLKYFKDKKNLLVIDICNGEGWEKLCPFLDKPIPKIDFPNLNKTNEPLYEQKYL